MALVILAAALASAVLWLLAAFVFRWRVGWRWAIPLAGAWMAAGAVEILPWAGEEKLGPGWMAVLLIFSMFQLAVAMLPALVIVFLLEDKLGYRAP